MKRQTQSFNDGVVNIYTVGNIAQPGNMPKNGLVLKIGQLRYDEKTVGMSRYWTAMQAQAKVEQIIRVHRINTVTTHDIAILSDGNQYDIIQVQYPQEVEPSCMDLSLQRLENAHDVS